MSEFGVGNYGLTPILAPRIIKRNDVNFTSGSAGTVYDEPEKKSNHTLLKTVLVGVAAAGIYLAARGKLKGVIKKIKDFLNPPAKPNGTIPVPPKPNTGTKPATGTKPTTGSKPVNNPTTKPEGTKVPEEKPSVTKPSGNKKTKPAQENQKEYPQAVDKYEAEMAARKKEADIEAAWAQHDGAAQTEREIAQYMQTGPKVKNSDVPFLAQTRTKKPAGKPKANPVLKPSAKPSASVQTAQAININSKQEQINAVEKQLKEIEQKIKTFSHPGMKKYNKILSGYQKQRDSLLSELQELQASVRQAA